MNATKNLKEEFYAKGWTLPAASKLLRRHKQHIHVVLQGKRKSNSLGEKIKTLPPFEIFSKANPNFFPTNKKQRKIR